MDGQADVWHRPPLHVTRGVVRALADLRRKNLNRKVGPLRGPGHPDGLTAPQAERKLRQMQNAEELTLRLASGPNVPTVDEVSSSLQRRLRVRGLRPSSLESYKAIQQVHVSPLLGSRMVTAVDTDDIEAFSAAPLKKGIGTKTVRNMLGFLHQVFEHGIALKLIRDNPVRHAEKPGGKKSGANPDIQFLTVSQLEAVICEIPDKIVITQGETDPQGTRWSLSPTIARCPWPCLEGHHPHSYDDRFADVRVARSSLARHRLDSSTTTSSGAQHLCSKRARCRREVRALNEAFGTDDDSFGGST